MGKQSKKILAKLNNVCQLPTTFRWWVVDTIDGVLDFLYGARLSDRTKEAVGISMAIREIEAAGRK